MDIEILLDCFEVNAGLQDEVDTQFHKWYQRGAEVRPNKLSFSSVTTLSKNRYLVDLGYADLITSFRNLHASLRYLGVKVFIHFNH